MANQAIKFAPCGRRTLVPRAVYCGRYEIASHMKKVIVRLLGIVFVAMLVFPLALYKYTISRVEKMPEKSSIELSQTQAIELWSSKEKCSPNECASTTPYWIYSWLAMALVNDFVVRINTEALDDRLSKMSSQIALQHLREGNFKGKGMLWWHLTHLNLSIWLQRNWSANEIASKFTSNNA